MSKKKSRSGERPPKPRLKLLTEWFSVKRAKQVMEEATENVRNRSMYQVQVRRLTSDHENGRWVTTGDTIKFDEDGYLIDGQHRMQMIINSGKGAWIAVCYGQYPGYREAVMPVCDLDGRPRLLEDLIEIYPPTGENGEEWILEKRSERRNAASATSLLYDYRNRRVFEDVPFKPSMQELRTFLESEIGLLEHLEYSAQLRALIPDSLTVFLRYVLAEQSPKKADDFLRRLATGQELSEDHPILSLRGRLIQYQKDKRADKVNIKTRDELAFVVLRAWLHYSAGEKLTFKKLKFRKRATEKRPAEPFPYLEDYPTSPADLRLALRGRIRKTKLKDKAKVKTKAKTTKKRSG